MIRRIIKALRILKVVEECMPEFKDAIGLQCKDEKFCGQGQMCKPCIANNAMKHLYYNYYK